RSIMAVRKSPVGMQSYLPITRVLVTFLLRFISGASEPAGVYPRHPTLRSWNGMPPRQAADRQCQSVLDFENAAAHRRLRRSSGDSHIPSGTDTHSRRFIGFKY